MSFLKKIKSYLKVNIGIFLAFFLYKILKATWRLHEEPMPDSVLKTLKNGGAVVLGHFHEDEWALLGFSEKKHHNVLVSMSEDGSIMAGFLTKLGFQVARGSPSRRAAAGLIELIESVKHQEFKLVSLAVDGPKGPRRKPKPGIAFLAHHLEAPVLFVSATAHPVKIFKKSWSHAFVPLPFSRLFLKYHGPIEYSEIESLVNDRPRLLEKIEAGILTAKTLAEEKLRKESKLT